MRVRTEVDAVVAGKIVEEFLAAALSGDTEPLIRLLTDGAVSVADGGGRIPARKTPINGVLGIARFLRGLFQPTDARRAITGGNPAFHAIASTAVLPCWSR
ncbi:MAG: hypothetical protein QOF25_3822 [Mycobacterium sp.]|nr:hypothetical protein [Mycobacterium sp.]